MICFKLSPEFVTPMSPYTMILYERRVESAAEVKLNSLENPAWAWHSHPNTKTLTKHRDTPSLAGTLAYLSVTAHVKILRVGLQTLQDNMVHEIVLVVTRAGAVCRLCVHA